MSLLVGNWQDSSGCFVLCIKALLMLTRIEFALGPLFLFVFRLRDWTQRFDVI